MVFPTNTPIARELDDFWKESQALIQQYWVEADIDLKMATGQSDYYNGTYGASNYRNQRQLQFNKILRVLNMVGGFQRDNRLQSILSPSDNDPDMGETADQRTTVLNWCKRQDGTYERISDCFDHSNMVGFSLLNLWMDFREDPENGEIKSDKLPFSAVVMDPYWTKHDLSDCDRIWTRRYITRPALKSIMPGLEKEIPLIGKGYAAKDGKFQFLPQNWYQYAQELYAYDEYWVREYKKQRRILDKATGEVAPWKGTREQFQLLRRFNPNVELISSVVPTVKMYILVNGHLVYEEKSPYGIDRYPFVPFLCYHYPEVQNYAYRYQGLTRNIRDPQIYVNRTRNNLFDIMNAQIQSGLMVKEDALVNPEDAFFQGPGKILYFKKTANLATDQMQIQAPPVAPGWMELIQVIEKEIMDIVGPEELFAQNMGAKEMTGVLMKLKMGAGLTGLRNIFDRLNQSQMLCGEIMDDMIVNNFTEGKVTKILGHPPTQAFFDNVFSKYSCQVEETEMTSTQRQLQFLQGMQMKQMGVPLSNKWLVEKSQLQGKKDIIADIQQQEQQAQQMQQAQMMSELKQNEILTRSIEAKAQTDFAGAMEKKAGAVQKIALAKQEASQAVHQRAEAALSNAKALHELDQMDEDRLIKLATFIIDLQAKQKQLAGDEEEDSEAESNKVGKTVELSERETKPSQLQNAINS